MNVCVNIVCCMAYLWNMLIFSIKGKYRRVCSIVEKYTGMDISLNVGMFMRLYWYILEYMEYMHVCVMYDFEMLYYCGLCRDFYISSMKVKRFKYDGAYRYVSCGM